MSTAKKNSLLCPNCRRLISRDESSCPYCGIRSPGSWWKNNLIGIGRRDPEALIRQLITVNVVMYILSLLLNPRGLGMAMNPFDFLSPDNRSLLLLGASGTMPIIDMGRWWSLLTANFLHGSLLHILFNMIALRQIGPLVLKEYGISRMLVIYLVGGVCGYLLSFLAGVRMTIGASAAVCALIGAALYYGKSRGGSYGQAVYQQISGWAIGIFIFGFMIPGINNWAHGGGMAVGALLGLLMGYQDKRRESLTHRILATLSVGACGLALIWASVTAVIYRFL
ncbi:MAG: rhomboid family intramembrane serine protease [Proteobacteria bacterium]|nr:rhomboid family intramembrane serine protease [Pseudomonadota bacterium]MBU1140207.1 rhomboid family intramembrane serine protease [Pseudomonadota bacterium]MBU1233362.1 rhomboid family intramembrane serine protease [Pseudomonadota bacterium]MBU1420598.1 rhomboid family intramembrane serine protease [Pseudomonadota bacterium]MBU1455795.1 rhomboid family intramembrane serine protease [Pseudomonadota bacterium]